VAARFHDYCTVVPYTAGGAVISGRKRYNCLVVVDQGELTIMETPQSVIDRALVSTIELDTPAFQRKVGEGTLLRMNGNRWAIDFGFQARAQVLGSSSMAMKILSVFGVGTIKTLQTARAMNHAFRSALLEEGATDRRGNP
jgi:hypothetical protein